jgi:putative ABC transport system permease protein
MALGVLGIAPLSAFARDAAYVSPELLSAVEAFRDGRAVPTLGWGGDPPRDGAGVFAGFRLYARSIHDVEPLRAHLVGQGVEARTRAAEIETVVSLDRNLSAVFWIVASIGVVGFVLSLASSLWGNVNRKRRELGVLRLVGYSTVQVALFPVYQAGCIAATGAALAVAVFALAERGVNRFFSQSLEAGEMVCQLTPRHIAAACLATLATAILAACYPGFQAARIEPSEALREQ